MIRDVKEIEALATKYSKQQLAHMAQIGMIDPTKAVMAGMMRDRISKEDAKPPTTTVAEDVLGIQSQAQMGMQPDQGQAPQGAPTGVASLPQEPQANAGIEALPAGEVGSYAGGGIVAFDDGGSVPGYAGTETSVVGDTAIAELQSDLAGLQAQKLKNPNDPDISRKITDLNRLITLKTERLARGAPANVSNAAQPIAADKSGVNSGFADLNTQLQKNIDKGSNKGNNTGVAALAIPNLTLPLTEDETITKMEQERAEKRKADKAAKEARRAAFVNELEKKQNAEAAKIAAENKAIETNKVIAEQSDAANKAQFNPYKNPFKPNIDARNKAREEEKAVTRKAELQKELDDINKRIAARSTTPNAPLVLQLQEKKAALEKELNIVNTVVPVAPVVTDNVPPVLPAPPAPNANKQGQKKIVTGDNQGIATPNLTGKIPAYDPNAGTIGIGTLPVPTVDTPEKIRSTRIAGETEEGVDPRMYEKLMSGVQEKKGKLEDQKGEAQGNALMQLGLGLMGARRGQEFQTLSDSGVKALQTYKSDMKDLRSATEKYDERMETLNMADQQARRTNRAADVAELNRQQSLAKAAETELFKAQNDAKKHSGIIAANLHHTNVGAFTAGQQLEVQKAQAKNSATYQQGMLGLQQSQIRNRDLTTQAKLTDLRMKSNAAFDASPEGAAFMKKLKTDFGDNYLTAPLAKARLAQAKDAYFQSQLAQMPEGSYSVDTSALPTPAQLLQAPQ